jgi:hypothetical protein
MAGFVIGSFGPDFQYFLRVSGTNRAWHYYPQLFTRCLPFTVIIYFIFMAWMRGPLTDLLPIALQRRIRRDSSSIPNDMGEAGLILVALLVGLGTHILWDALTHSQTWFWKHIAFLHQVVHIGSLPGVYGYEIAQAASSVLGIVILGAALVLWYRRTPAGADLRAAHSVAFRIAVPTIIILLAAAGAIWRGYHAEEKLRSLGELASFQLTFVITSISIFLWGLLIYGAAMTFAEIGKGAHR